MQTEIDLISSRDAQFAEAYDTYTKQLLALDDLGWKKIVGGEIEDDGFSLEQRKDLAKSAREAIVKSPLLKRGRNVRANNVFGKGAPIQGKGTIKPSYKKLIDDPINQEALFGPQAQLDNDGNLFSDGTHFSLWSVADKQWETVPYAQITDIFYNPARPSQVWYYLREYSTRGVNATTGVEKDFVYKKWIRVDSYQPPKSRTKVRDIPIDTDKVMVDLPVNRESQQRLGVPDCLPALYWNRLYEESMLDKAKLNRALSTIAWLVKQKSAKGAANAGAKIATKGRSAGQTAVAAEGTELTSMPRSGSIDFTELRPIASMVATALEVSTVAILSDSGAASGSNAAETTLDAPTLKSALVRQELWRAFYKRCFVVMGIPESAGLDVNFPSLDTTPLWRQIQSSALAFTTGGIHQEEHRAIVLEALDFIATKTGLPQPNAFTGAKKVGVEDPEPDPSATDDNGDPIPSQGNSGDVGALNDDSNEARANGEFE